MTSAEWIATLLRGDASDDALAHVAECAACFDVLAMVQAVTTGAPARDTDAVYGCDAVADALVELALADASEIRARHPALARHLAWCEACRVHLMELRAVEHAALEGAFGPPIVRPETARWLDATARVGRQARELAETIIAEIRRGVAVVTALPQGLVVSPLPVPAARGEHPASVTVPAGGESVAVPLPESGESLELVVVGAGDDRVSVEVRLVPAGDRRAVSVRALHESGEHLIGSQTVYGSGTATFGGLPPGRYVVVIETPAAIALRVPLMISAG